MQLSGLIRYAASLGTQCYAGWLMNRIGVRRYALPFDFIFSDLGMVAHCVNDGFRMLLDRSQYVQVDKEGHCSHTFYSAQFDRPIIFNHHNVTQEQHYMHFVRSADRFRRLLAGTGGKLFLCVSEPSRATDQKIEAVSDAISARTADAQMVVVRVYPETAGKPTMSQDREIGMAAVFDFSASSRWVNGLTFRNDTDNKAIEEILENFLYQLDEGIRN
jgi:hypothetical protein